VTVTGWNFAQVNAMEFPDVLELQKYWLEFPPVHLAIRGLLQPKGSTWNGGTAKQPLSRSQKKAEEFVDRAPVKSAASLPAHILKFIQENRKHE
jgi:hypothetical protein